MRGAGKANAAHAAAVALQPEREIRAAHLEAAPAVVASEGAQVASQVLAEQTVLLGSKAAASAKGAEVAGGRTKAATAAHAGFRPVQMKLSQLRVPMWLQQAHGAWHAKQEQSAPEQQPRTKRRSKRS